MNKLIITFLILLCLPWNSNAYNKIETLKDSLSFFNEKKKANALLTIANYYFPNNNDSALLFTERALKEYQKINSEKGIASCYGLMGAIYSDYGMYDTAISLTYKVIDWGEKNNDIRAYFAYLELANTYKLMGELNKAKEFYIKALEGSSSRAKRAAFANLGLVYLKNENYDSAAYYFTGGLKEYFKSDTSLPINKYNIATMYLNLSSVDYGKGEYAKGIKLLNKSLKIFEEVNNEASIANVLLKIGEGYKYLEKDSISLEYFFKAKQIVDSVQYPKICEDVYFKLFEFYQDQGDFEKALHYHIKFDDVRDSLVTQSYKKTIIETETKYNVQNKINKIESLEEERQAVYSFAAIIILSLMLISAIIILVLNNRRLKHKSAKALADAKSHFAIKRANLSEQKLDKITQSLHSKSDIIEQLEKEIRSFENKQDQTMVKQKVQLLKETRILTDNDWEEYNKIFLDLHPEFCKSIENISNLSTGDRRQLIFIKLGLNQKEIAHLMGISPIGAKKAKQRLSKKIGLPDTSKLEEYVEKLAGD